SRAGRWGDVRFARSAAQPATPDPSSGVPGGWSSTVSSAPGSGLLWSSVGTRPNAGANWTWQTPVQVEGEAGEQGPQGDQGAQGDPGDDAISVSITASNGVQFRQATGGTWEPSGTTTDITFTVKQSGSHIATHVARVTRSDER